MIVTVSIISLLVGLGKLVDNYMYKNEKITLYKKTQDWIDQISNTKVLNLHFLMIEKTLNVLNRFFNRKKLLKSIVNSIILSWVLTTLMFLVGLAHPSCLFKCINPVYWHDYLPWYPAYIVNYFFDIFTIFFTVIILNKIKNSSFFIASLGIFFDLILSAFLLALCILCFLQASSFFFNLSLGKKYIDHQDAFIVTDEKEINLDEFLSIYKTTGKVKMAEIKQKGFSSKAKVYLSLGRTKANYYLMYFKNTLNGMRAFFRGKETGFKHTIRVEISENEKVLDFEMKSYQPVGSITIAPAMTTFLPIALYLFILYIMFISKEISNIAKSTVLRIFRSLLQRSNEDDILKFNPGIHISILLSVVVLTIKVIVDLF